MSVEEDIDLGEINFTVVSQIQFRREVSGRKMYSLIFSKSKDGDLMDLMLRIELVM